MLKSPRKYRQTAECHPNRKHKAKGLCHPCYYRRPRTPVNKTPHCHPLAKYGAKGLCESCYRQLPEIKASRDKHHQTSQYHEMVRRKDVRRKGTDTRKRWYRNLHYKRTYGISIEQKEHMISQQNNQCANPGCKEIINLTTGHVDHNHSTSQLRAILCRGCNTALGLLEESSERMAGLIQYITLHSI